ncbi:hypothetical protein [Spongiactinospora sp. 9N601]|uniref:hypothetical protein n=1 Tax=Spongiactinospora sp. 9N601 TaxID=3375149 RepID=UPI0037BB7AB5
MTATMRYEYLMQVRRPTLWLVYLLVFAVTAATLPFWSLDLGGRDPGDPRSAMLNAADILIAVLPMVYGCMIADRPGRDRALGVDGVLNAIPAGRTGRLLGKYLGVCAATATPFLAIFLGRAAGYAVIEGEAAALGWSLVVFLSVIAPGLAFLGALAFAGPLLVAPLLFRVLFVAYWFWGNLIPVTMMPTLSHTVLSATGEYAVHGWFEGGFGPRPEAALDVLRPEATPLSAALWVGVMIVLAAAMLVLVRLHAIRSES